MEALAPREGVSPYCLWKVLSQEAWELMEPRRPGALIPWHHGTQPGAEEEGLSSVGLLAPAGLALPQFPCVF